MSIVVIKILIIKSDMLKSLFKKKNCKGLNFINFNQCRLKVIQFIEKCIFSYQICVNAEYKKIELTELCSFEFSLKVACYVFFKFSSKCIKIL